MCAHTAYKVILKFLRVTQKFAKFVKINQHENYPVYSICIIIVPLCDTVCRVRMIITMSILTT